MHAPMQTLDTGDARPTREALLAMFRETATEVVEKDFHHAMESMAISELAIDSLGILEDHRLARAAPAYPDTRTRACRASRRSVTFSTKSRGGSRDHQDSERGETACQKTARTLA